MSTRHRNGPHRRLLVDRQLPPRPRELQAQLNRRHRLRVRWLGYFCLPLALLIRAISPFLLISFGHLLRHKIGHCPLEAEFYLLERQLGLQPKRAIDLFYFARGTDGLPANLFAQLLVTRALPVSPVFEWLDAACRHLDGGKRHLVSIACRDRHRFADRDRLMQRMRQQIDLSPEDEAIGAAELEAIGVPKGAKFVCFHARDEQYWKDRRPGIKGDSDFRNSDLSHYIPAMQAVTDRGYYVVRLGHSGSTPLEAVDNPRIIDYATRHRSEFMDLYLAGRCHLMVSTASGIDAISYMFRRPMVFVNVAAWGYMSVNIAQPFSCIFKRFRRHGQLMTFNEVVDAGAQDFATTPEFEAAGIELEENSSDEIMAAVLEMIDRLEGKPEAPSDAELRTRMKTIIGRLPRYADWQFDVAATYLAKYRSLL